jgi:hypothetical protein
MTILNQNIKVNRGDTVTIFVALTHADGTPFDPTDNVVIKWRMMPNWHTDYDDAVIRKDLGGGIALVGGSTPGINIELHSDDTKYLIPGLFYHELKVWDDDDVATAMTGTFIIRKSVVMNKAIVIALKGEMVLSPKSPAVA